MRLHASAAVSMRPALFSDFTQTQNGRFLPTFRDNL